MILWLLAAAIPAFVNAQPIMINFETFPDGTTIPDSTPITSQFPGITFTETTVITSGISLNEFELPPHSGDNVAFDDGGPITIDFSLPISSFGGYFTYYEPLTMSAFDIGDNQVATATSAYSTNVACGDGPPCLGEPGSSPNELISVSFGGISSITITGDPAGTSFVMDDISYTPLGSVPEPSSITFTVASCLA